MAVQIVPSVLAQQVEDGMKLKPLAEHYGLPVAQMKLALKAQNLTIRKFHAPKFEFVEEPQQGIDELSDTDTNEEVLDINLTEEEGVLETAPPPAPGVGEEEVEESETEEPVTEEVAAENGSASGW